MRTAKAFVVTGGAQGIGRAIVQRLSADGHVVVVDVASAGRPAPGTTVIEGDAGDDAVAHDAAAMAEAHGELAGWVNNAAVFNDVWLHEVSGAEALTLVARNLGLALTGCRAAVRHFLAHGRAGAIVNVSSHQGQRPVRGALTYATAKGAIETLTRALAVDYGPAGIRTNAVSLGSIATERSAALFADHPGLEQQTRNLHPLDRLGRSEEVATVVAHLLSSDAAFVNGAIVPVDGGRAALGTDPEARSF